MTMRATGIKVPGAPRVAADAMTMGQATQAQAARGIGTYARLDQQRAEMNEEIKGANKSGLGRIGGALGGVAGTVVGGMVGGPVGAAAGSMIGSAAGGLLGGMM